MRIKMFNLPGAILLRVWIVCSLIQLSNASEKPLLFESFAVEFQDIDALKE